MTENERDTPHTPSDQSPVNDGNRTISHAALLADMEQVFTEARPRLLQLAHLNGMSPDMADDVVQETSLLKKSSPSSSAKRKALRPDHRVS